MKDNPDKCHFIASYSDLHLVKEGKVKLFVASALKLLGLTIDNEIEFENHIDRICVISSET